jgi:transcriptional regulator GlxA family with amidase domain
LELDTFVVVGDFQIMSCAAVAAFDVANIFAGRRFYQVRAISEQGGIARSSIGVAIETARLSGSYDTLLVAGLTAIAVSLRPYPAVKLFRDSMYASLKDKLPADVWDYSTPAASLTRA